MEKIKRIIQRISEGLELGAAGLVLAGILFFAYGLVMKENIFQNLLAEPSSFNHYLELILMLVIGLEFLQMLCRPNADNVIEILIFLVARHMIVGTTTPLDDFVSVISICILCALRRYLHNMKEAEKKTGRFEDEEEEGE